MAGHSHSANIAVRKNAQDKVRAKLFTKLMKEIYVAIKLGGPEPENNAKLRAAIARAKAQSVPKDKIQKALNKNNDDTVYEDVTMEGYGPGGVAVLARCLTDNRNRTAADVRHAFSKHGGNLGTSGCVGYLFQRRGVIEITGGDEDEVMMTSLDAGAEDIVARDGGFDVFTTPDDFDDCLKALQEGEIAVGNAEVTMMPDTQAALSGSLAQQFLRMLELLNDCDDVQQVYHNAVLSASDIEAFANS